jgi:hypothetical protein
MICRSSISAIKDGPSTSNIYISALHQSPSPSIGIWNVKDHEMDLVQTFETNQEAHIVDMKSFKLSDSTNLHAVMTERQLLINQWSLQSI